MKKEQLERGNDIQDMLRSLRNQLEALTNKNNYILRELTNNCSGKIDKELEDLESILRAIAVKNVKARIDKLEKEFTKL